MQNAILHIYFIFTEFIIASSDQFKKFSGDFGLRTFEITKHFCSSKLVGQIRPPFMVVAYGPWISGKHIWGWSGVYLLFLLDVKYPFVVV